MQHHFGKYLTLWLHGSPVIWWPLNWPLFAWVAFLPGDVDKVLDRFRGGRG